MRKRDRGTTNVDKDKIAAQFRNGLLVLTLPKSEKLKEKRRRIRISKAA